MKGSKLYIRIINLLLIVIILLYYNSSMKTYALEEKKDKIQAELDAEKNYSSGLLEEIQEVLGTEPVTEAGNDSIYKDGTYTNIYSVKFTAYRFCFRLTVSVSGFPHASYSVFAATSAFSSSAHLVLPSLSV